MRTRTVLWACFLASAAVAQNPPAVNPRGVINAYSFEPALSTVGRGGVVVITGLNMGPDNEVTAPGRALPLTLGDPAVEVSIGGRAAPLFSVSGTKIVAQVPFETPVGLVDVVVKRGGIAGKPARITVNPVDANVASAAGSGYGPAAGGRDGQTLKLRASGLGVSEPRVNTGELAGGDASIPAVPVAVFIGGLKSANVTAKVSPTRVGEYDIQAEVPTGARPGDVIAVVAGNRRSNLTTFESLSQPDVQFLKLPDGAPELRALMSPDLNGNFWIANGARGADGCYPSVVFDAVKQSAATLGTCLTSGNANAVTPVVAPVEGTAVAALVGPPAAAPPQGISSKLQIFDAAAEPMSVDLPGAASQILGGAGGNIQAVIPGTPTRVVLVDPKTGEVRDAPAGAGGGAGGAGGALALLQNFQIDVDGLKSLLAIPVPLPQNRFGLIVGDDADAPKRAKFVIASPAGEVVASKDFPDGWQALVAPRPPQAAGGGPGGGGAPGGGAGGAGAIALPRGSVSFDTDRRIVYALAKLADNSKHGFAAFTLDNAAAKAVPFPDGWFAPACSASIRVFNLELARQKGLIGTNVQETAFRAVCPGVGFLVLDNAAQTVSAIPLPGQAQFNSSPGASGDVNDYVYGSNTDPARPNTADSLFVLDGPSQAAYRLDLPSGVTSFGNITVVQQYNLLIAPANNRVAGDAGLIVFDMDRVEARLMPVPSGFSTVSQVGVLPATRKVVARGVRPNNGGSQLLIYDLYSGDVAFVSNPEGVDSVGPAAAAGPGGGGPGGGGPGGLPGGGPGAVAPGGGTRLLVAHDRSNTAAAIALGADGKQVGVIVVRVP